MSAVELLMIGVVDSELLIVLYSTILLLFDAEFGRSCVKSWLFVKMVAVVALSSSVKWFQRICSTIFACSGFNFKSIEGREDSLQVYRWLRKTPYELIILLNYIKNYSNDLNIIK